MKDTRLIQLLSSFSAREIKLFSDFVKSPYFNKNEKTASLACAIIKCYPAFENKLPAEEKLFAQVFKGEKYEYFKFRNYISDVLELALEFLKYEGLQGEQFSANLHLLESLRKHNQEKIYEKEFQKAEKRLQEMARPGNLQLYEMFRLKKEWAIYNAKIYPNTRHEITQHGLDAFIEYILLECMSYYGLMLHEKMQNNIPYDLKLFEEMFAYAEDKYDTINSTTRVYIDMVRLMQNIGSTEKYERLKKMLREYHNIIPFELLERGYVHLIDFCAFQINSVGNNAYCREVHNLHKDLLAFGIQTKGNIPYQDFLNTVKMAAVVKEFEWVENFIHEYGLHLTEQERDASMQFSYAVVAYYKEQYNAAARYMSTVNFKDPIMKIQVKANTIRYLYEGGLYEQLLSFLESFTHYLRKEKKLSKVVISSHEEFSRHVRDLVKIQMEPNKKEQLRQKEVLSEKVMLMQSNYFGTRNWLKKKLGIDYLRAS
jgi:hypothetical protein